MVASILFGKDHLYILTPVLQMVSKRSDKYIECAHESPFRVRNNKNFIYLFIFSDSVFICQSKRFKFLSAL